MRQVIYVKYNRTRAEQFQLKTSIVRENGILHVEKTALSDAGIAHIQSFASKFEKISGQDHKISFLKPEFLADGRTVCFPFLTGKTVGDLLGEGIVDGKAPMKE